MLRNQEDTLIVADYQEFITDESSLIPEINIPEVAENGLPVVGISSKAFTRNSVQKLIIEYSEDPIVIASYAFQDFEGEIIIINRDIKFENEDWDGNVTKSEGAFANLLATTLILPNTITELGNYAFINSESLKDIRFITPLPQADEEALGDIESSQEVYLPNTPSFDTLGKDVFSGTTNIKNYIFLIMLNMQANIFCRVGELPIINNRYL